MIRTKSQSYAYLPDAIIPREISQASALEKAEAEIDPARKAEILQIAKNLEVVPCTCTTDILAGNPAILASHLAVTTELNPWDAFSPGRMDQHLYQVLMKQTLKQVFSMMRKLSSF